MQLTASQVDHFQQQGFILIPNVLSRQEMREIDIREQKLYDTWRSTEFPKGMNRMVCFLLMVGEPAFKMIEREAYIEIARQLHGCDEVFVPVCAMGNAQEVSSMPGKPAQIYWHSDAYAD